MPSRSPLHNRCHPRAAGRAGWCTITIRWRRCEGAALSQPGLIAHNPGMATQTSTARVIGAGVIGNLLEWYDFAIYGFFAAQIGHTFFPVEDKVAQILSAFGIFAIGYVMRPLGGVVTGYIGD